jgi:hypothetical protein
MRPWTPRLAAGVALVSLLVMWPLAKATDGDAPVPEQQTAESRAIAKLRTVQAAQATYRGVHGYYDSLECLALGNCTPQAYPPRYLAADFLGALNSPDYRFQYFAGRTASARPGEPLSPTATEAYALIAVPRSPGSAHRAFCADATGRIHASAAGMSPPVTDGQCVDTGNALE